MRTDIRLALPSKGRLQLATLEFLSRCGFDVKASSARSYIGSIAALPSVTVLFQRPRDIVTSVANGGVEFGITGLDVIAEANLDHRVHILHDALGYGKCRLVLAAPETWSDVQRVADLRVKAAKMPQPLRVATVFPFLTEKFLREQSVSHFSIIEAEGSLEVMPEIGAADIICDLVETGNTLAQNRLRMIDDGTILNTQAVLIANRDALDAPAVRQIAIELLEYIEAHQRAEGYFLIWANVRGKSLEHVGERVTTQTTLGGLQGPTIAQIYPNTRETDASQEDRWFSVSVVVARSELTDAIEQMRGIGGSGVIVTPVTYIFEERPNRVQALRRSFENKDVN
jgi:ATP phosphoribosyltransferase